MKKFLIFALCFVLMFAVAAVSAQDAETAEAVEEAVEEVVEEPAEEPVEEPAEEPVAEEDDDDDSSTDCFKVIYLENDCLAEVPTDKNTYAAGTEVTALFEPVAYKDYLIFYGWDIDDDGVADLGYNYDKFTMPEKDAELKAICIGFGGSSSTCKDCHLHGVRPDNSLKSFTGDPYGSARD